MNEINDILAKHFSGESSSEEEKAVLLWKKENEVEYIVLSKAWNETIDFEFKTYDHQKAWNKIDSQIVTGSEEKETVVKTKSFTLKTFIKYAAAACAALLIGWTANWYFSEDDFLIVSNDSDNVRKVELPDGSSVWMAPDSEIEYAREFDKNRDLKLDGEAYFEVERDEQFPFVITTEIGEVEVLGTKFNVNSMNKSTVVYVEGGVVALRNNSDEVILHIGESAVATDETVTEIIDINPNVQSWRTGVFTFNQTPLEEVVLQLNKYYKKEIIIESENVKTAELTAQFNDQKLDEIIEIIVLTCGVRSESSDDKIILK